jgi:hypothetical protein
MISARGVVWMAALTQAASLLAQPTAPLPSLESVVNTINTSLCIKPSVLSLSARRILAVPIDKAVFGIVRVTRVTALHPEPGPALRAEIEWEWAAEPGVTAWSPEEMARYLPQVEDVQAKPYRGQVKLGLENGRWSALEFQRAVAKPEAAIDGPLRVLSLSCSDRESILKTTKSWVEQEILRATPRWSYQPPCPQRSQDSKACQIYWDAKEAGRVSGLDPGRLQSFRDVQVSVVDVDVKGVQAQAVLQVSGKCAFQGPSSVLNSDVTCDINKPLALTVRIPAKARTARRLWSFETPVISSQ